MHYKKLNAIKVTMSNLDEVDKLLKEAHQELQKEQLSQREVLKERLCHLSNIQSIVENTKAMIQTQMANETAMGKQPFIRMLNGMDSILLHLTDIRNGMEKY
jgi:hypothetical protein